MHVHRNSFAFAVVTLTACGGNAGADLDGTWQTACYEKTQTTLHYDALALTGTFTEFSDDACTDAIHISEWTGTATVGDQLDSGGTQLDLAFATFTSTPLTAENAETNNGYVYCGFTDWAANVEKDILGADCYGFSIPEGGMSLDIYEVDGDSLRFGVGAVIGTDLTEADRPTKLDDTRVFTRVTED